jgi:hypothetical protein
MSNAAVARPDRPVDLPLPPSTLAGLALGILAIGFVALVSYRSLDSRKAAVRLIASTDVLGCAPATY